MRLELEFAHSFCYAPKFVINGVEADSDDFGYQSDVSPESAEEYACGDMQFIPIDATDEVLKKYNITAAEYELVAGQLKVGLSFGNCGWCV